MISNEKTSFRFKARRKLAQTGVFHKRRFSPAWESSCATGTRQNLTLTEAKDAEIKFSKEDFASCMGQSSNDAATTLSERRNVH